MLWHYWKYWGLAYKIMCLQVGPDKFQNLYVVLNFWLN